MLAGDSQDPSLDRAHGDSLLSFTQELSLRASYDEVLCCASVWIPQLFPHAQASLTFPLAVDRNWSIGAPTELVVTELDGTQALATNLSVPMEGTLSGQAFLEGKIVASDGESGFTEDDLDALGGGPLTSSLHAPLIAGGETIGTLNVALGNGATFSDQDQNLLRKVAGALAAQCLLHRRISEARASADREAENARIVSLLQRLQLKLAHLSGEDEICRTTAHHLKRIFRAGQSSLALLTEDRNSVVLRALGAQRKAAPVELTVPLAGSIFEYSVTKKQSRTWKDWSSYAGTPGVQESSEAYQSAITVPLAFGNDVLGTLNLASPETDAFGAEDVARITELGRIVGTALASLRANQALLSAQEDAEAASAAKGAFLANVSHELRTPLNGVLGMAQLLEGTPLDEEQQELVGTIKSSGQLLMRVIRDVLEVSKIESGSTVLEVIPFDPFGTVEKACAMVSPAAAEKGIELRIDEAPTIPRTALGDPTRLQQIVVNLLSNAVKFTVKGGVYVTMKLTETLEGSHRIEIAVRDTGKGIAQHAIERIFVPFQQEEASTTRRFGGTGLGLAICKQFAELMGGDISASSQEGEGSVFTVNIALGVAESEAGMDSATGASKAANTDASDELRASFAEEHPLRILVVDDNPVNRRVAQRLLQRLGFEPELAADGQEAIDATRERPFDLVLMDLSMPQVDGFEANAVIRDHQADPPIVVALTADVQETTRERCIAEGMAGLLAKPFSVGALKEQLVTIDGDLSDGRQAA